MNMTGKVGDVAVIIDGTASHKQFFDDIKPEVWAKFDHKFNEARREIPELSGLTMSIAVQTEHGFEAIDSTRAGFYAACDLANIGIVRAQTRLAGAISGFTGYLKHAKRVNPDLVITVGDTVDNERFDSDEALRRAGRKSPAPVVTLMHQSSPKASADRGTDESDFYAMSVVSEASGVKDAPIEYDPQKLDLADYVIGLAAMRAGQDVVNKLQQSGIVNPAFFEKVSPQTQMTIHKPDKKRSVTPLVAAGLAVAAMAGAAAYVFGGDDGEAAKPKTPTNEQSGAIKSGSALASSFHDKPSVQVELPEKGAPKAVLKVPRNNHN